MPRCRRLGTPTSGRHALRDRAAHGTAPTCGMGRSRWNGAEGTFPDLGRPRRRAARRPRAFGPLCRPEVGVPSRFRRLHDERGCVGGRAHGRTSHPAQHHHNAAPTPIARGSGASGSCCENAVRRVGRVPRWRRRLGTPTSGRHALRDRAAHGTAPTCGMGRSRWNGAEGTFPDLGRPRRRAARRPRAFGPLCRPEVGVPSRFRRLHDKRGCAGGRAHRRTSHPAQHHHNAAPTPIARGSGAPACGMGRSRCDGVEGTFPDLCRPRRRVARRPRAFGPLCRPEVGVPSRFRRFHDTRGP